MSSKLCSPWPIRIDQSHKDFLEELAETEAAQSTSSALVRMAVSLFVLHVKTVGLGGVISQIERRAVVLPEVQKTPKESSSGAAKK
jgi:hypothetical protein